MIPTPCSDPDPEDDPAPFDLLPPFFREHSQAAVARLRETIRTNERRALAGHPPVPCQLTGEQAEALGALVWGLTHLSGPKGKGGEGA